MESASSATACSSTSSENHNASETQATWDDVRATFEGIREEYRARAVAEAQASECEVERLTGEIRRRIVTGQMQRREMMRPSDRTHTAELAVVIPWDSEGFSAAT